MGAKKQLLSQTAFSYFLYLMHPKMQMNEFLKSSVNISNNLKKQLFFKLITNIDPDLSLIVSLIV